MSADATKLKAMTVAMRNAVSAIEILQLQIEQMRGMFADEDGTIQAAIDDGDEAAAEIEALLK